MAVSMAPKMSDSLQERTEREYRDRSGLVRKLAASYPFVTRAYSVARFTIIRARILGVMDVLLPAKGRILELGCGFGLFAGYFAATERERSFYGVDRDPRRIAMAQQMAKRMGLTAEFAVADVRDLPTEASFDAAYLLDVLHHIPYDDHRTVLDDVRQRLPIGGRLLVKDITTYPAHKLAFTWALDRVMAPKDQLSYRHHEDWKDLLQSVGFEVRVRHIDDYLPYPHVLFICDRVR